MDSTSHLSWPRGEGTTALVLGIAGGTGSGKTTVVDAILEALAGEPVAFIEHDAYYRDLQHLDFEERAAQNFDHPDAFETELMVEHIHQLRKGIAIDKPVYDYATHLRTSQTTRVEPAPVLVVDGILVLSEERLRDAMDLKIFVDTDADVRLVRRIQRDIKERGRSPESVLEQYMTTVRPMHLQFVEPSKRYADIIIPEGYNPGAVGTVSSMIRDFVSRNRLPD
ncbi:MAG: uridine kinase [Acidimicrobiia bacterium]